MEEHGGLFQVQRVHGCVESRMDSPSSQGPQGVELAQTLARLRPIGAIEVSVVETSGRAYINTRDVASATVTVA